MKKHISIPAPSFAAPGLPARGKYRAGRVEKPILGKTAGGAFGKSRQTDAWRAGTAQANAIASAKADKRTYRTWFLSLSTEDQSFARQHGLHKPLQDERSGPESGQQSEDALDHAEHETIPEHDLRGIRNGRTPIVAESHPILDEIEPLAGVEIPTLTAQQADRAGETFGEIFRWILEPKPEELVEIGQRAMVAIAAMHRDPSMLSGLVVDPTLARAFIAEFAAYPRSTEAIATLQATGQVFENVLAWLKRSTSISGIGERAQIIAYHITPDLLDGRTLAGIGATLAKTRQAVNKPSNCLRDTFAGLKARVMRSYETRIKCQQAQLCAA